MNITENQYRILFVGFLALGVAINIWDSYQNHVLRKLQKEELKLKLNIGGKTH